MTSERSLRVVPTYTSANVIGCNKRHQKVFVNPLKQLNFQINMSKQLKSSLGSALKPEVKYFEISFFTASRKGSFRSTNHPVRAPIVYVPWYINILLLWFLSQQLIINRLLLMLKINLIYMAQAL